MPADPAAYFSPEEIATAKRYVTPLRRLSLVERVLSGGVALVVIGAHAVPKVLSAFNVDNWVLRLVLAAVVTSAAELAVSLVFGAYRELGYDKRWGFSTQTVRGFISDAVKAALLTPALLIVVTLPFWFVVRHTDLWWVIGWLVVGAISVGLGVLSPVLIDPIFNKFTRLDDDDLHTELVTLAREVGADLSEVQVSDASRRSTKHNAYVTGMGKTRKLVVFDTMLTQPRPHLRSVAAHEIGHWRLRHIRRIIPVILAMLLLSFVAVRLVVEWDAALRFAGVHSFQDPAALPLFLFVFALPGVATGLLQSWFVRAGEREADLFALEATRDADAATEMERNLHVQNLADLAPSRWQRLTASHPPAAERLAMIDAWRRARSAAG